MQKIEQQPEYKIEPAMKWKRTHTCGELNPSHAGKEVVLMGWVDSWRDHGGIIFIDLRDRYGITQIVFNPEAGEVCQRAKTLRNEFVVAVLGKVVARPAGMINKTLATGEVEVNALDLQILNPAKTTPFEINGRVEAAEDLRLKYRYLDLRRPEMQRNLIIRHRLAQVARSYFDRNNFVEIETPILMRSTPEGARDYLVPSRIHHGSFYALPQSPQTYKQILMVAGMDRYVQIVKCFRDEDLRADRQPEFTQIDVEMSFVNREDVIELVEGLMAEIMEKIAGQKINLPLLRLTYAEAMARFGSDKPDLRFGMELKEATTLAEESEFKIFSEARKAGKSIIGVCVPGGGKYSRKQIDDLTEQAAQLGAKGLVALKVSERGWEGAAAKFFKPEQIAKTNTVFAAKASDLLLFVVDEQERAQTVMGALRLRLGAEEKLIDESKFSLLWVIDFPLLEFSPEDNRWVARHHPFTAPMDEDVHLLATAPEKARAKAYDLVMNGYEIAGGSVRIHRRELQERMFRLLNIGDEEARNKFGFLLEAFEYGAPPHGGIAFGFDRLAMLLAGRKSIREVIAFPKTNSAVSLMDGSPAKVDERQLRELHIQIMEA
jgi:aspartyl-tRNA synthetase